tara:strand:- start:2597 stop:3136 length:540 start_codon:yes stop_codon:yes gene_type:complete
MADQKQFAGTVNFTGPLNLKGETTITGKLVSPYASVSDTHALTADMSGQTVFWTKGSTHHITLPAPAAGLHYKIVVAAGSNNSHKIKVATEGTHYFFGSAVVSSTTDNKQAVQVVTKSTANSSPGSYEAIELDQNASTTGGAEGSVVEIWGIDSVSWLVKCSLVSTNAAPSSITTIQAA